MGKKLALNLSFTNPTRLNRSPYLYKSWSHGMTNLSVPEVNLLKISSILAVSVAINLSIKLDFVSVNGPRETYFVDVQRMYKNYNMYKNV